MEGGLNLSFFDRDRDTGPLLSLRVELGFFVSGLSLMIGLTMISEALGDGAVFSEYSSSGSKIDSRSVKCDLGLCSLVESICSDAPSSPENAEEGGLWQAFSQSLRE